MLLVAQDAHDSKRSYQLQLLKLFLESKQAVVTVDDGEPREVNS